MMLWSLQAFNHIRGLETALTIVIITVLTAHEVCSTWIWAAPD